MYKEMKVYYEVDEKKSVERNRYLLLRHLMSQALWLCWMKQRADLPLHHE